MARPPDENSRTSVVARFFEQNPHEYLTIDDVAVKFGCSKSQARNVIAILRNRGDLETTYVVRKAPQHA